MKSGKLIWKILLILGIAPFLLAVGFCLVSSLLDGGGPPFGKMSFWDYLIFYSFLYWYTYVMGMVLIVLSAVFRSRL